jgi:hypothetical protein
MRKGLFTTGPDPSRLSEDGKGPGRDVMNKHRILGTVAVLSFVLAGCDSATSPTRAVSRAQLKAAGLHMVVSIDRPGAGTIRFRVGVENRAETDATLHFTDGQFFDIEISDSGGYVVWSWSHDKGFTQSLWDLTLGPNESYIRSDDWDLAGNNGKPVSPGSYTFRVWITCTPRDEGLAFQTSLTI